MSPWIPHLNAHRVFVLPWTTELPMFGWIMVMGFLVTATCGLVGKYLILRRMALVGDAISHSVLPGLAIAFITTGSRGTGAMFLGALIAAVLTTVIIQLIHMKTRIKQDSAIGIAFSTLFASGVILISLFADKVDLDQDCVLNGEMTLVPLLPSIKLGSLLLGPPPVVRMAVVACLTAILILAFYKELLVSSFDPVLSSSMGVRSGLVHHLLMIWLAIVVVSAFEAVGAILVIAMLILPGATASLLTDRLPLRLAWVTVHAALSSILGTHLAVWLDCSIAGAMVVAGACLFALVWIAHPQDGLLRRAWSALRRGPPASAAGM